MRPFRHWRLVFPSSMNCLSKFESLQWEKSQAFPLRSWRKWDGRTAPSHLTHYVFTDKREGEQEPPFIEWRLVLSYTASPASTSSSAYPFSPIAS